MRRPLKIKDQDINLPLLTVDDFDTRPINTSVDPLKDSPFLTDKSIRKTLADICIAQVNLLLCIGRIIQTLYHLRSFGGSSTEAIILYKPKTLHINADQIAVLQNDLDWWYRNLPVSCWLSTSATGGEPDGTVEDALFIHRSVLRMIFLMATESLNRPQTLLKTKTGSEQQSTSRVNEVAEEMSEMTRGLQQRNLVRFLPPLTVNCMLLTLAAFLVEFKKRGQAAGALPGGHFHQCIRTLWQLRDCWPIADSACFLIGQMISQSQIGGTFMPGILPTPMATGAPPSDIRQPTASPQEQDETLSFDPVGGSNGFPAADLSASLGLQSSDMGSAAIPEMTDPYAWTASEMDQYGVITNGQALHMDFALLEYDGFADLQYNFFGLQPSPQDDQLGGGMSYASSTPTVLSENWNQPMPNHYIDPFGGPRST